MLKPIPGPPGIPFLGNIFDVRDEVPVRALAAIADTYGPIYKLSTFGRDVVIVSDCKLVEEICDEKRFFKALPGPLEKVKRPGPAGLFQALSEKDPDWQQGHRTLISAFGPIPIRGMFDEMHDIATQLILKWARLGPEYKIPVTDDFTRLTLDTIALCAMDFRFNSFYQDELHPFVRAMQNQLAAGNGPSSFFGALQALVQSGPSEQVKADQTYMNKVAMELVTYRREHPTDKTDLLNSMINGKDPKTGERMRDELVATEMITFLVAGHETTSGLLSFAFMHLLKNPAAYRAAQAEVDRVCGTGKITVDHIKDLKYITAVLRETLRLCPTVPAFARIVRDENEEDPVSLGGYELKRDVKVLALIFKSQIDPKVFGEDAEDFRPERLMDGKFEELPKGAWTPFGTGVRACIGRPFAWQEAMLVTALVLQTFDLRLDEPSYEKRIKQTLTIKPDGFYMRATLRPGMSATKLQESINVSADAAPSSKTDAVDKSIKPTGDNTSKQAMLILYGSNAGTCQSLAQRLASDAEGYGYAAKVIDMDGAVKSLPTDRPVVVITSSYEGQPPDNAARFVDWLESLSGEEKVEGVNYAVFGCGHSDWATTFQRIPILVDEKLAERGAKRIISRGLANAADGDMFSDFDHWAERSFWPAVSKSSGAKADESTGKTADLEIEMTNEDRASRLRQDVKLGLVEEIHTLTAPGEPEKRHMAITLPSNMFYEPGDYLAVLPKNPDGSVKRVMIKFRIPWDAVIKVSARGSTTLPVNVPVAVWDLLKGYVELSQPATRKDIKKLCEWTKDSAAKADLESLSDSLFRSEVLAKRLSVMDILGRFGSVEVPFNHFLAMLPPMRLRHYSISSSPLSEPTKCTITYGVLKQASLSGQGEFEGVAGSYLKSLKPGDPIQVSVRATNKYFHLPLQAESVPIIMFGAGSGLAPFRGFIQHRAKQLEANPERKLAPAILFAGCRSSTRDRLYADEFDAWAKAGAVDVRYAFSKDVDSTNDAKGCKYVQDRMLKDKADILHMWDQGAKVFVCGNPPLAEAVRETGRALAKEKFQSKHGKEVEDEKVSKWFSDQKNNRFVTDVFA